MKRLASVGILVIFALTCLPSQANVDILRSADRPQLTEKPHTVGEGVLQLEGSAIEYGYEKAGSFYYHSFYILPVAVKYGVAPVVDLFAEFETIRTFKARNSSSKFGIGDLRFGAEYNAWGNREYQSAMSIAPFVKLPTNSDDLSNNAVEFGVKVPFSLELKDEFTFGAMLELDLFEDLDGDGYHLELVNSVSVSRPIIDAFAMYVEYFSRNSFEDYTPWVAILGFGGVFAFNEQILGDATLQWGLSEGAEDVRVAFGATYRF